MGPDPNNLKQAPWLWGVEVGLIGFSSFGMTLIVQAAILNGLLLDAPPLSQAAFAAPEVDVGWGQDSMLSLSVVQVLAEVVTGAVPVGSGC